MEITYKKMTEAELGTFIKMRITQLTEEYTSEGNVPPKVDLEAALWDYYHRHMADGTFVSWLALDGEKIVGTSGMTWDSSRYYVVDHYTGQNGYRIMKDDFVRVFGTLSGDENVKFVSLLGSEYQNIPGIDAEQVFFTLNSR